MHIIKIITPQKPNIFFKFIFKLFIKKEIDKIKRGNLIKKIVLSKLGFFSKLIKKFSIKYNQKNKINKKIGSLKFLKNIFEFKFKK